MRPVEAGQLFGGARANGRRVEEHRAEQRQRQAEAAEDDVFPGGFERSPAVVKRDEQHGRQRGGFHGKPHHAEVVGQHDQQHAGREQRREHVKFPHAAWRQHAAGQVAAEIAPGVKRARQRHDRDEQHHPRAEGVGAQEFVPLARGVARVRQHGFEQLHAQNQPAGEARDIEEFQEPARPGDQAEQPDDEGHTEDGGQQHWSVPVL